MISLSVHMMTSQLLVCMVILCSSSCFTLTHCNIVYSAVSNWVIWSLTLDHVSDYQLKSACKDGICIAPSKVTQMIFAVLEEWYHHIVLTHSFKLVSFLHIYLLFYCQKSKNEPDTCKKRYSMICISLPLPFTFLRQSSIPPVGYRTLDVSPTAAAPTTLLLVIPGNQGWLW